MGRHTHIITQSPTRFRFPVASMRCRVASPDVSTNTVVGASRGFFIFFVWPSPSMRFCRPTIHTPFTPPCHPLRDSTTLLSVRWRSAPASVSAYALLALQRDS